MSATSWRRYEAKNYLHYVFHKDKTVDLIPHDCLPVNPVLICKEMTLSATPKQHIPAGARRQDNDALCFEKWAVEYCQILGQFTLPSDGGVEIITQLRSGKLLCASDGSIQGGCAAYAYCVGDDRSPNCLKGGGQGVRVLVWCPHYDLSPTVPFVLQ